MSDDKGDKTTAAAPAGTTSVPPAPAVPIHDLMAAEVAGKVAAPAARKPRDLAQEAITAAERALAEGEQALANAQSDLSADEPKVRRNRGRELALRALLAFNVLAMIVVAALPAPAPAKAPAGVPETAPPLAATGTASPAPKASFSEPYNRALAAAEKRDFAQAVTILDKYLADSPRMLPSQQLSVLMALAHYAARNNDFKRAQDYQRRADAIDHSHSLPEDLVAMAKAAADNGDQEALRRVWARFLLQQRQIPSWLYKHVAEAYLQLGESYRKQANAGEEQARLQELEDAAARLRQQAKGLPERGK